MATQAQSECAPRGLPALIQARAIPATPRKKLVRRGVRDRSQILRHSFQAAFLLLNLWLGGLFYFWVRSFETGSDGMSFNRPAGVDGWLPIAGLMNLKYWLATGHLPVIHPAAMFLFLTFLAISFLFHKAFCSWLCPIGGISEFLWRAGQRIFRRNLSLPRWLDLPLRSLKYLLLGFFVSAVATMPASAIEAFMRSPYGIVADVKMLNFFRYIGEVGLIVISSLSVLSVVIKNFWCRYLCPYGALLGLAALASPMKIRRLPENCIDCGKCAKACPSALPVDKLVSIKSAECTACLECVAVCPAENALHMGMPTVRKSARGVRIPAWAMATGIVALFLGIAGSAKISDSWNTNVPARDYKQLVLHANEARHPMPGDPELR